MADEWDNFMDRALLVHLKNVLSQLNLPTSGTKLTLKARILKAVESYTDEQLLALIPNEYDRLAHGDDTDGNNADGNDVESSNENQETDDDDENQNQDDENLDNEIRRLQSLVEKKRLISWLKKELMELQIEDKVTSRSVGYTFKDFEDSTPTFSGDDNLSIQRWVELFEESAETMQLDEKTKFIYGKRLLTGTAKLFIRTISSKTRKDLKSKLKNEFKKHVTKADLHD